MNLKFFVQSSTSKGSLFSVNHSFDSLKKWTWQQEGCFSRNNGYSKLHPSKWQQKRMTAGESLLIAKPERKMTARSLDLMFDLFRKAGQQLFHLMFSYHSLVST